MQYGFGVDVGGTTVKIALLDRDGTLLSKWEIPTRTSDAGRQILPDIAEAVLSCMKAGKLSREDVLGVGIGVPGPVNSRGEVNKCHNLGWGRLNIPEILGELLHMPVVAGNDATLAALGECWKGGGQGVENMVLVTLGTGVGGGIVSGGRVIHGAHGAGGEIGHIVLNRDETEYCTCGKRGCVEQYCSATGIVRLAQKAGLQTPTCKEVFAAAAAGDPVAGEVLEQVYAYLGEFLADVCCVADPEVVVLGGGVSKAGQPLLEGAARYFTQYAFHACRDTRLALATLGNDAGAYGAWKLLLDTIEK